MILPALALAWILPAPPAPAPGACTTVTAERDDGTLVARAACAWDIPHEQVAARVIRYDQHDRVFSVVEQAEALGQDAAGRALVRQVHGAPLLTDREVVLVVDTEPMPDGLRVTWDMARPQPPPEAGRVQPLANRGVWEVCDDGRGGTRLDYEVVLHPGGDLPSAVVSWLQGAALRLFFAELEAAARG